jgi:hypothetical protein
MDGIENYSFVALLLIIVIIVAYIYNKMTMQTANCTRIKKYDQNTPKILSELAIDKLSKPNQSMFDTALNNVFVKTAYNCCCTGQFKNDYVGTCALENCYNQGVRALHFEIYLLNNKPVISSSSISQPKYKEIYNELDFYTTMKTVNKLFTTNNNDPLFLILEINSDNYNTYLSVYNTLYEIFGLNSVDGNRIMLFDSVNKNFGDIKLLELLNKVVIMVSYKGGNEDKFNKSGLKTISTVNLSLSDKNKMISYNKFLNSVSTLNETNQSLFTDTLNQYKQGINIIIPDKLSYSQNYDFISSGIRSGFTFIALNFQYEDDQIKKYNSIFNSPIGTGSFVLKKHYDETNMVYYSPSIQAFIKQSYDKLTTPIGSDKIELYKVLYP